MPNTGLLQVTEAAANCKDDAIFLLGGTNDTIQNSLNTVYSLLENELIELSKNRPVLLATIPKRFDETYYDYVTFINNYTRELVVRHMSAYLVDLEYLERFHFS